MKLGIISDTHARTLDELPPLLLQALARVDLIIHAGDITEKAVLNGLATLAPVKAVAGNMDSGELKRLLPPKEIFTIQEHKIGLIHGWGAPWGISHRIIDQFNDVDIIIYGHSHEARDELVRGVQLFNPGRARDSYGLIDISDKVRSEIIRL
jgi:putative phosphoesterase